MFDKLITVDVGSFVNWYWFTRLATWISYISVTKCTNNRLKIVKESWPSRHWIYKRLWGFCVRERISYIQNQIEWTFIFNGNFANSIEHGLSPFDDFVDINVHLISAAVVAEQSGRSRSNAIANYALVSLAIQRFFSCQQRRRFSKLWIRRGKTLLWWCHHLIQPN